MGSFFKKIGNPMFWIGVQTTCLLMTIGGFIDHELTLKWTLIYGTIQILLIGLDRMSLESEKKKMD